MCGIFGLFTTYDNFNRVIKSGNLISEINSLYHRGRDGYGYICKNYSTPNTKNILNDKEILFKSTNYSQFQEHLENLISLFDEKKFNSYKNNSSYIYLLTHFLHSIEGFRIQPLYNKELDSSLIFNGEIYNYKELAIIFNLQHLIDSSTNNVRDVINDADVLFEILNSFTFEELLTRIQDNLQYFDGDFACVYVRGGRVIGFRDILGVKPLWYSYSQADYSLIITSQRTFSENQDSFTDKNQNITKNRNLNLIELLPIEILEFDLSNNNFSLHKKEEKLKFDISLREELELALREDIEKETYNLLKEAVRKRIPSDSSKKIGLLFSGGVDSTVIALILQELGVEFTCYTAHLHSQTHDIAEDYEYSLKIAQKFGLDLKVNTIELDELEELIKKSISIIDDRDYIKVSVALPFVASCMLAQKDGVDIMFSGLGSEEIFAGYRRHKQAEDVNLECLKGLQILHIRDLYRDDVITMNFTQELRVPFLDKKLINYALNIPISYKIDKEMVERISSSVAKDPSLNALVRSKIILRDIAMRYLHLDEEFANRQKKAAQYGSKFDKGILRLAKNKGLLKQEYLYNLQIN